MADQNLPTILCITTFEKGQEFMRECKRNGWAVLLMTVEKLKDAPWPRESLDETYYIPEDLPLDGIIHAVSYMARTQRIDRIVALDEFDMEKAAALREHMRIPGMGLSTLRYFRDKLAMRAQAHEKGVLVPEFVPIVYYPQIREYMQRVPGPWVLKPRQEASAIGIRKIHKADDLWPALDQLGDKQTYYLLEQFVPGEVFHVDSVVSEHKVVFQAVSKYGHPPMQVAHEGGIFTTRILPRDSADSKELVKVNKALIKALGLLRGVTHAEFIQAKPGEQGASAHPREQSARAKQRSVAEPSNNAGKFYFLECAARVGGAYINEMVEAASAINLWREWARIEIAVGRRPYKTPQVKKEYSGIILSLAQQAEPDTTAYTDPEIKLRLKKHHHAGFVLASRDPKRVAKLLDSYAERFMRDFMATAPLPDKPTA